MLLLALAGKGFDYSDSTFLGHKYYQSLFQAVVHTLVMAALLYATHSLDEYNKSPRRRLSATEIRPVLASKYEEL